MRKEESLGVQPKSGAVPLDSASPSAFVSVIIPCLNEISFIGKCLDSVLANDYAADCLEIIVIDGMSTDGTREVLAEYSQRDPRITMLDNPKKITPAALNVGVRGAKGEIIVRLDAHSTYDTQYISKCVHYLTTYDADNVGGIWITVSRSATLFAQAATLSLSHYFGVGNAHYRIGQPKEPRWVDTVPYGCFRKSTFDRIGLFDESCHRNEDVELNTRIRRAGGKILLVPDIVINYFARTTFRMFCRHNFNNGIKVTFPFQLNRDFFSWRHLVPLFFLVGILAGFALSTPLLYAVLGSYAVCNVASSLHLAVREKNPVYVVLMPPVFALLHLCYGCGSLYGLAKSAWAKIIPTPA
jgi:glycosyltransferase involved in cell wall biosynthesis